MLENKRVLTRLLTKANRWVQKLLEMSNHGWYLLWGNLLTDRIRDFWFFRVSFFEPVFDRNHYWIVWINFPLLIQILRVSFTCEHYFGL